MKVEDKIIRSIARKYGKDQRVVRSIVYHPLLITKRVIEDLVDNRPTRIRYFGAFVQKPVKNKEFLMNKKREILLENIGEVFEAMLATGRHTEDIDSEQELKEMVEYTWDAQESAEFINDVWGIWKEHIK